jgi:hypothetical protein
MTSEAEVERQIRKALMVRATQVRLRDDIEAREPFIERAVTRRESPRRDWPRRLWALAVLPATAALIAAIVFLATGLSPTSQKVVLPSAAATTGPAVNATIMPPARRAGGGVVLAWQGRWHQPAEVHDVATTAPRTCGLPVAPAAMVHGLRSPDCLE